MIAKILGAMFIAALLMGFGVVVFAAFTLIPFLLAWNYVSPLFSLPYLDWSQALAILVVFYAVGAGFKASITSTK